ncbi:hypothetical protein HBI56_012600 [Parastagonospora nodorum]|uniref:Uncharacterized protein n=2 Tax=Phaeosphaeria nodorum (strain SN15 / ATCC MYA-4574 / FGSC 10173) TaxID=321614 RepID=A0A7U2ET26_PHANO|nr:hypothetical protein SNOG_00158 [Parastagonospora nodorum SN15]KAH3920729.1 hypothetical protein HBH56_009030 [Parastagonospora nodorum]EAT91653.1 hypothetical protein SNOG_00158 [Parastagonospora nodorum SN15]KAH3934969.1 hypothetical protein HBH54_042320 [Parastagonospora nodorum]KAH3939345.1 hypothetical protein HBH53_236200 [Parastagonospora nodorum]KAH3986766.1 hypothetical protein HBH51_014290 [Parastagonospora nodorum]
MEAPPKSPLTSLTSTLTSFFALYFTTLFSLDSYTAARNSPFRPANQTLPPANSTQTGARSEYQAGMHGRGRRGPGGGEPPRGGRDVGGMRDSGPAVGMGANTSCGACMT